MTNLDLLAWEPQSNQATYLNKDVCPQGPASFMSAPCLNLPYGPLSGGMLGISSEPEMYKRLYFLSYSGLLLNQGSPSSSPFSL